MRRGEGAEGPVCAGRRLFRCLLLPAPLLLGVLVLLTSSETARIAPQDREAPPYSHPSHILFLFSP